MAILQIGLLCWVAHVEQIGELGWRQHEGIQDKRRFARLRLSCQGRLQRLHFLVEAQLGVREIEIAQTLGIDEGQPLLATGLTFRTSADAFAGNCWTEVVGVRWV